MEGPRFDALARTLSTPGSRRRVLGLLTSFPILSGLAGILTLDEGEAKDRRRRRKKRHKRRRARRSGGKGCRPKSRTKVCAGKCGLVKNRKTCGKRIDCGPCECNPPCQSPTPTCVDGVCTGCTSHAECGSDALCVDGTCHACDVTCNGGTPMECGAELQTSLDGDKDTLYVCPGTYEGGFSITRPLSVIGAGAEQTILDGNDEHRVMVILETVPVTLRGLAITRGETGGNDQGAGLNVRGDLTLIDAVVFGNHATGPNSAGGGIYSIGALTLRNTIVRENSSRYGGGVHLNVDNNTGEHGSLTLESGSRIEWNEAKGGEPGYGGGFYILAGTATLQDGSWISHNTATGSGGAIYHFFDSSITVEDGAVICENGAPQCDGFGVIDGSCPISVTCPA